MQSNPTSKFKAVLAVIIILVIVVGGLSLLFSSKKKSSDSANVATEATYSGDGDLIDRGVTATQVDDIKFAIHKFKGDAKRILISNVSHIFPTPASGTDTFTFNMKIDNQSDYGVKLECPSLTSAQLFIYNIPDNNLVFDSHVIDTHAQDQINKTTTY